MGIFGIHRHLKREMLSEYLDGRLNPTGEARVDRELASCGVCQEEIDSLRATVSLLEHLPEVPLPRNFTLATAPPVESLGRPLHRPGPWFLGPPSWAYAGAASLAGLALAVLVSADATGQLTSEATLKARATAEAPSAAIEAQAVAPTSSAQDATRAPTLERAMAAAPQAGEMRSQSADADSLTAIEDSALAEKSQAPPALEFAQGAEAESTDDAPAAEPSPLSPLPESSAQTFAGAGAEGAAAPDLPAAPEPVTEAQLTPEAPVVQPAPVSQVPLAQERRTALVWRILEGVAGGLGLLFLLGLTLKWRRSRRVT